MAVDLELKMKQQS